MTDYKIPAWCKDAVLTDRGVASMITGELYISKKGAGTLPYRVLIRELSLIKGSGKTGQIPKCCIEPVKEPIVEPEQVIEAVKEPEPVVEPKPVKTPVKKPAAKKAPVKKTPAKKVVKKDA